MLKDYQFAVVFGGVSSENEVSVITGTMVCNVLKKGGKSVLPVYVDHGGIMRAGEGLADVTVYKNSGHESFCECALCTGGVVLFRRGKPKIKIKIGCVINCCHGGAGEGGGVAGACALYSLPLASAGLFESAAFMDKYYTKLILNSLGIETAPFAYSRDRKGAIEGAKELGFPLIVKPATLGSSIGIARVDDIKGLYSALNIAFGLDGGVILEKYLTPRREINCAAYLSSGKVHLSRLEEVKSSGDFLSYDDKYTGGGERIFPAELPEETEREIKESAARVYVALNMRGIVRFDYILSEGKAYLSEINTVPGSLSQYLVSHSFADFFKVLCGLAEQAVADLNDINGRRIIRTGILNNLIKNTCKIK